MAIPRPLALVVLVVLVFVRPAVVGAGEETTSPLASPIRAVLFDDDAGLERFAYDGIRDGLEDAKLPRVRQETPFATEEGRDAILARLEAEPPPLLFVLGPTAGVFFADKLPDVPRVFVDTAWYVNGEEYPPTPNPIGRAAVVRAVVNGSRVAEVLRRVNGEGKRHVGMLSWPATSDPLVRAADALATAAGFDRAVAPAKPDLLLHLRLGLGEEPASFTSLVARARREKIPLVSDDVAHWQRGAAIVVLPDLRLLGRVAANVGRMILAPDERAPARSTVNVSEIHVDIRAAEAEGLVVPLECLAWADRLRRGPVRWPAEGSAR